MPSPLTLSAQACLPADGRALLVGRAWVPAEQGPSVVAVRGAEAVDLTRSYPTVSQLLNTAGPADVRAAMRAAPSLGPIADIVANSVEGRRDPSQAVAPRAVRPARGQGERRDVRREPPRARHRGADAGRPGAGRGRAARDPGHHRRRSARHPAGLARGRARSRTCSSPRACGRNTSRWASGPTRRSSRRCPPMAAVGPARRGRHASGLGVEQSRARAGARRQPRAARSSASRLGNDVNLRDVEGRSALLLGSAKDNNASCAIGPFFRLLRRHASPSTTRAASSFETVVEGADGFRLVAPPRQVAEISRDLADLAGQALGRTTSIPTGSCSSSARCSRRSKTATSPGSGFTHKVGDVVSISSPDLGTLVNEVVTCDQAEPWTFGTGALMANLARRNLLHG